MIEPGGAEQRRDLVRSTQREHARSPDLPSELGELGVSADRIGDQHQPLVGVKSLPTDEHGTAVGGERVSDVGESPHGIIEEHQSELADQEIERAGDEVVSLCVSDYELRVGDPCNPCSASCQLHERLRQVDADDAFGVGGRGKRRRARPTADIEHDLVRAAPSPF